MKTINQLHYIILARLLASPPGIFTIRSKIIGALKPFIDDRWSRTETQKKVEQHLVDLENGKLIIRKKSSSAKLSEKGKQSVEEFLGLSSLKQPTWRDIRDIYLCIKILNLNIKEIDLKRFRKIHNLLPLFLMNLYSLPIQMTGSFRTFCHSFIWAALGENPLRRLSAEELQVYVMNKLLANSPQDEVGLQEAEKRAGVYFLGIRKQGVVEQRKALLRKMLSDSLFESKKNDQTKIFGTPSILLTDLNTFLEELKTVIRHCPTGWYDESNILINHVWKRFQEVCISYALTLDRFKNLLLQAHQKKLIQLRRADLNTVIDPVDFSESEISYLSITFHFIYTGASNE